MEQIQIRTITNKDNPYMATIIRRNLEKYQLDIPGTAYFDNNVDHLSDYYSARPESGAYFVLTGEQGQVLGGSGFERVEFIDSCVELQKLYIQDSIKGKGYGRRLVEAVEGAARGLGFTKVYLETHSNLREAVQLYKKLGYREIPKPDFVVHTTMDLFFIKEL